MQNIGLREIECFMKVVIVSGLVYIIYRRYLVGKSDRMSEWRALINNSWTGSRFTKLSGKNELFPSGCDAERTVKFGVYCRRTVS